MWEFDNYNYYSPLGMCVQELCTNLMEMKWEKNTYHDVHPCYTLYISTAIPPSIVSYSDTGTETPPGHINVSPLSSPYFPEASFAKISLK